MTIGRVPVDADEETRTPTVAHRNLNPARLPIPPHPHCTMIARTKVRRQVSSIDKTNSPPNNQRAVCVEVKKIYDNSILTGRGVLVNRNCEKIDDKIVLFQKHHRKVGFRQPENGLLTAPCLSRMPYEGPYKLGFKTASQYISGDVFMYMHKNDKLYTYYSAESRKCKIY